MILSLIAAAAENNVIGKDGGIPWDLPDDFKHFHDATQGCPVIMGRKTHESIGRVLPGRRNIVITRQAYYKALPGCDVVHSIEEAMELADDGAVKKVAVIGGEAIYAAAMSVANEIDLTRVHAIIEDGSAFFPEFSEDEWELTS